MKSLNLGILAHVDAGKTSLTERLLYAAGIIDEIGSVDKGNTQTDSLALERQRGITIKAAVTSFVVDNLKINLIDTPGHPDFIAEVERVLSVLDGVVLVIPAVEGVQPQTRIFMRTLQRLKMPTIIFVNKIDRAGARHEGVLQEIAEKLTPEVISMGATRDIGTRAARFEPYGSDDADFVARLGDLLASHSDAVLAAYASDGVAIPYSGLQSELGKQAKEALVHPVFFGSAITGAGVTALFSSIGKLLPAAAGEADGPVSATVFKIERGQAGEKIAYTRMFSGVIGTRDQLHFGDGKSGRVTAVGVFDHGSTVDRGAIQAGEIGKLWGLADIQIGDAIGALPRAAGERHFAPPSLETVIVPLHAADKGRLHAALEQLAEQDPLINLRQDDTQQEIYMSLYGEVQKEVIQDTLANDFDTPAEFRKTSILCVERPNGTGEACEVLYAAPNPFLATIGLRIEPAAAGSGVGFKLATAVLGTMPIAFFKAVEDTVHETLKQGLYGWQLTDCMVTMTRAGYAPRQSHAHARFDKSMSSTGADFRGLTPLVLMDALKQTGTTVCEPIHHFELEVPAHSLTAILPMLTRLRAIPQTTEARASSYILQGDMPAGNVHDLQLRLPDLTSGEGVLQSAFGRYAPVRGNPPIRPRTDSNPLDRKEYLLRIARRG